MKATILKSHTCTFTAGYSFSLGDLREFIEELTDASNESVVTAKIEAATMRDPATTTLTVTIK